MRSIHPILTLLLSSLLLQTTISQQTCDTSVYHVNPQGACNICPDNCPPECDPSNAAYLVFTSSDCDGQGVSGSGGGDGGGAVDPATTTATAVPVDFTVEITPSNATCEGDSCSPKDCVRDDVSVPCDFGDNPPVDWELELASVECKVCQQNTESDKCGTGSSTLLATDAGIRASYCNDQFLVIWSTGLPHYDPSLEAYLGSIPLPPGGDPGCRVRTARELLTVYKIPLEQTVQEGTNVVPNPLPGIPGLPAAGGVGVSLDGVVIYPVRANVPVMQKLVLPICNSGSHNLPFVVHSSLYSSEFQQSRTTCLDEL